MNCYVFVEKTAIQTKDRKHSRMVTLRTVLKTLVPLAVSVGLIVWLFHKVNLAQIKGIISHGVDYRYIVAMMCITVLSHMIRGYRWGIQLRAAGIARMPVVAEWVSIFGAYALNLVIPFIGEAWRCVYVSRRQKAKLSTVVGTDLGDRASDGVMILSLLILTLFVAHPAIMRFLDKYPLGEAIWHIAGDWVTWVSVLCVAICLVVADRFWRNTKFVQGVNQSIVRMWNGFKVLFYMKGRGLYVVLTFGIWICYYLEAYVCFFAFPFTRDLVTSGHWFLGLVPGLVVFVFGSCSMIVPSNGGLGPWNIAVMFALSLFGISESDGAGYSIVCWSFQAIALVASGIFAAFYIMLGKRRDRKVSDADSNEITVASEK